MNDALILAYIGDLCGFEWRDDYSGRCMMGKQCVGWVVGDIGEAIRIALRAGREYLDPEYYDRLFELLDLYREDSMGLDHIMYWPNVSVEEVAA